MERSYRQRYKNNSVGYSALDTSKYDDELMEKFVSDVELNVLSFVAENERKNIKQRQAKDIDDAKTKGARFRRPAMKYPDDFENLYKD